MVRVAGAGAHAAKSARKSRMEKGFDFAIAAGSEIYRDFNDSKQFMTVTCSGCLLGLVVKQP
jgi:hydroxyethylthiazole kinase-like sugar kinase family protein